MYTIGEISKMFNIPISTLRYYDKQGLFPKINRKSGIRVFTENEIESIRVIECLKLSGLKIYQIKEFMSWTLQGSSTFTCRKQFLEKQKEKVENEISSLYKTLDMLNFKIWYYLKAIELNDENKVKEMIPDKLPNDIKKIYENTHK